MRSLLVTSLVVLAFCLAGCNGEPPPPPPQDCELTEDDCPNGPIECRPGEEWSWEARGCEPVCVELPECESTDGVWRDDLCECDCGEGGIFVPITGCERPPPPPESKPEDYYPLAAAGTYDPDSNGCDGHTGMVERDCTQLQFNAWAGWRDADYVARHCAFACADGAEAMFPYTVEQMYAWADLGESLDGDGRGWMKKLPVTHRWCDENDPYYTRFCGRSNVRKEPYASGGTPEYPMYREAFTQHLDEANAMRAEAQKDPIRDTCAFDSIAGWCSCTLKGVNVFALVEAELKKE